MCVTYNVVLGVIDSGVAINRIIAVDIVVDIILIGTENHGPIGVVGNVFINIVKILPAEKLYLSIGPTDERYDRWFVVRKGSVPLFVRPLLRPSACFRSFSPAVTYTSSASQKPESSNCEASPRTSWTSCVNSRTVL